MNLEYVLPEDIERRSFEIIESELHGREFPEKIKPVMYRVIHTTADFRLRGQSLLLGKRGRRRAGAAEKRRGHSHGHQHGEGRDKQDGAG